MSRRSQGCILESDRKATEICEWAKTSLALHPDLTLSEACTLCQLQSLVRTESSIAKSLVQLSSAFLGLDGTVKSGRS